jgi:hypothetical protein
MIVINSMTGGAIARRGMTPFGHPLQKQKPNLISATNKQRKELFATNEHLKQTPSLSGD